MRYALETLWYERQRYFAGVLAVAFSALLMALQFGSLIGLVSTVSAPVDLSSADVWIAAPNTTSCDGGQPISKRWRNRLGMMPGVVGTDEYIQTFTYWKHPAVGSVLCIVAGINLDERCLGPSSLLTPQQKVALVETGSVLVDRRDGKRLGVTKVGDRAEIFGKIVRVVGFVDNMGSMTGPYVICSLPTARHLAYFRPEQTIYLLARCEDATSTANLLSQMKNVPDVTAYSRDEFSLLSRLHWITTTKAGIAVAFVACLGLLVGTVVTSQTLYSATASLMKELAVLRAIGIPRWRMTVFVMQQAMLIGVLGLMIGTPIAFGLAHLADTVGTRLDLPNWLLIATAATTLGMAALSGLISLRSLAKIDPAKLLR